MSRRSESPKEEKKIPTSLHLDAGYGLVELPIAAMGSCRCEWGGPAGRLEDAFPTKGQRMRAYDALSNVLKKEQTLGPNAIGNLQNNSFPLNPLIFV